MIAQKLKLFRRSWLPIHTEVKLDTYDIRKYQATDIANELTLINQKLLCRIKPEELFNFAFLSTKKVKTNFVDNFIVECFLL